MVINGVELYLSVADFRDTKVGIKPGYILYVGNPDDAVRKKIRNVIAFCLGNYLVHLGCTTLCQDFQIVSLNAVSAFSISGRVFELPVLPPAPLGKKYEHEVDQDIASKMVNAIYAKYDDLRFGELSWAYWHALCAPVHMAAAHFGAAIEALQRTYMERYPAKFQHARP